MSDVQKFVELPLKIQNVFLRECHVVLSEDFDIQGDSLDSFVKQGFRNCMSVKVRELDSEENNIYEYKFCYGVGSRFINESEPHEDKDIEPVMLIEAQFEAVYHSNKELEPNDVTAFSEINVGYHVWPFWRELVQSSSSRVGLTAIIDVPFYHTEEV